MSVLTEKELKPCPFCGGKASYIESGKGAYWIKCYRCRVETEAYDCKEEALKVWNRRAGDEE